jgi:hypothetical protein
MCDCITEVNKTLKEQGINTELDLAIMLSKLRDWTVRPKVTTKKIDGDIRGKPKLLVAAFCPFCGEKYPTP